MKLSNQTKISIFSAVCLLGLVVVLKNVLQVSAEILSRDIILYIPFYSVISIIYPSVDENKKCNKPIYWYISILIVTLAILAVYVL